MKDIEDHIVFLKEEHKKIKKEMENLRPKSMYIVEKLEIINGHSDYIIISSSNSFLYFFNIVLMKFSMIN